MSDICNLWEVSDLFPELGSIGETLLWEIPPLLESPNAEPIEIKAEAVCCYSPLESVFLQENPRDVTLSSLVLAPHKLGLDVVKESMEHTGPTPPPKLAQEDTCNLNGDNSHGRNSERKMRRNRREKSKPKTNEGGGGGGSNGGMEADIDIDFEELVKLPRNYKGSSRLPKIPVEEQTEEFRMKVARAAAAQEKRERKRKLDVLRIEKILDLRDRVTQLDLQLAAEKQRFVSLKVKQFQLLECAQKNTPTQ